MNLPNPTLNNMRALALMLGTNIRRARFRQGLTQAQVAESIGVRPEVYGRIERGALLPGLKRFVAICRTLEATPNQLLGCSNPQANPPGWDF